jgi:hypothetical protein
MRYKISKQRAEATVQDLCKIMQHEHSVFSELCKSSDLGKLQQKPNNTALLDNPAELAST